MKQATTEREKNTGSAEQNEGREPERDFSKDCERRSREAGDVSGDDSKEDPPVPIPNTEVKLFRVDDTWRATAWESRTLPEYEGETVPDGSQAQVFLFRRRKGKMILK